MSPVERMHAEDRKTNILQCALPLFAMKGFAATTTHYLDPTRDGNDDGRTP